MAGLWPLQAGTIAMPDKASVFYLSQRPYLVAGTLRDQLLYPLPPAGVWAVTGARERVLYMAETGAEPPRVTPGLDEGARMSGWWGLVRKWAQGSSRIHATALAARVLRRSLPPFTPVPRLALSQSWRAAWQRWSLTTSSGAGPAGTQCSPGLRRCPVEKSSAWPWRGCCSTAHCLRCWTSVRAR